MKANGKTANVAIGSGIEDTHSAREAVVHATLRFGQVKVRMYTDQLGGRDLLEARSPAVQPNTIPRL